MYFFAYISVHFIISVSYSNRELELNRKKITTVTQLLFS